MLRVCMTQTSRIPVLAVEQKSIDYKAFGEHMRTVAVETGHPMVQDHKTLKMHYRKYIRVDKS